MKKFLTSTAIAAALLAGAGGMAAAQSNDLFLAESDPQQLHASEFIGMRVYAAEEGVEGEEIMGIQDNWEDVGEINDIILSRDGSIRAVLVDLGGFLGIGERQVALSMDQIKFVSDGETDEADDFFLVISASRANLEEAPEYARAVDTEMTEERETETAEVTEEKVETETEMAAEKAAEGVENAAEQTEVAAEEAAEGVENAAEQTEMAAEEVVREGEEEVAETETPFNRDAYEAAETEALTTEDLTGARVYDANDEWIGEISQLTVTDSGQIEKAVIDVGGFLGIGEKPVALGMDQLEILRERDGDDVRIYVSATKEELEAMPTFDK